MKLHQMICDRMVLQANKPIRLSGEAEGAVEVEFAARTFRAEPVNGKWELTLPATAYGGPIEIKFRSDGEEKVVKDVMIGEVILCAGQSNIQFTCGAEGRNDIKNNGNIRFFNSDCIEAREGIKSADGWVVCKEENVRYWSAIGYRIADLINKSSGVAVGIVGCYQGASNIQSWMPKELAEQERFYVDADQAHYDYRSELYKAWNRPGRSYNYTFLPISKYTYSSVVWYQGESNTSLVEGKIYKEMLKEMIAAWRKELQDEKLPFVLVQICDLDERNDEGWRIIQRAQAEAVEMIENTVLVTSSDVCDHSDIHPQDKKLLADKIFRALEKL